MLGAQTFTNLSACFPVGDDSFAGDGLVTLEGITKALVRN